MKHNSNIDALHPPLRQTHVMPPCLSHGSLFSGIGGFDLAAQWMGWKNIFQVEKDDWCRKVLAKNFPKTERFADIKDFTGHEYTNRIDVISGGFPCFTGNTIIATKKGFRNINLLSLHDKVLTHNSNYKKIKTIMERTTNEIYEVKIQGLPEAIETTAEHPFYLRKQYYTFEGKSEQGKRLRNRHFTDPEFVEVKKIKKGDYVGYVIDKPKNKDKNSIDFWYLIGRYIGDGWTNNSKRKSKIVGKRGSRVNSFNHKVYICTSLEDADNLRIRIKASGYHATEDLGKSVVKFIISNTKLFDFVTQFGQYAHGKHLTQICFELSFEKQKALFDGWKDADGYKKSGFTSVTTVSRELAFDMARIARNAYKIPVSISKTKASRSKTIIEGREVKEREQYRVRFTEVNRYGFYEKGYVWCPIKSINVIKKKEQVFNIEVDEENTYTANGIAVHNCQPFSVAGQRKGKDDDRYLWEEMLRVIATIKPTYVVGENVTGIIGLALDTVLSDLEAQDYTTETFIIPACGKNAWHRRDRVWIVAYANSIGWNDEQKENGKSVCNGERNNPIEEQSREQQQCRIGKSSSVFPNTESKFSNEREYGEHKEQGEIQLQIGRSDSLFANTNNTGCEEQRKSITDGTELFAPKCSSWWEAEPGICRVVDGLPKKLDKNLIEYEKSNYKKTFTEVDFVRWQILRNVWNNRKFTKASPRLQFRGSENSLSKVPYFYSLEGEELGERIEEDKKLCSMWERIYSKPLKETQDLQLEMLIRIREAERSKEMGKRVDRLKGLGNAIVPQVAFELFKAVESVRRHGA